MKKILIIDDDPMITKALELHLKDEFVVFTASSGREGLSMFESIRPQVVIVDVKLPDMNGLEALDKIKILDENANVIVVTALCDMDTTIKAVKKGAFDYITKPINIYELDLSIKRAIQNYTLHKRLKNMLDERADVSVEDIMVGKSRVIKDIFKTIGMASQNKVTTLIQGESGTGKELIARAIHFNSEERDLPLVVINCSALVETLLESELFGHEKGSFTGAISRKEGKFESAHGGSIFLDEIGEMSQHLQAKLLRVLQEKTFARVGGNEEIKTDVRIIAATNKNLEELVKKGLFREDLYYRLNVISIKVPSLKERKEDIPLLVRHFLKKANEETHKNVRKIPDRVMDSLVNYSWPGNIRELENVITNAVLLAKSDVLMNVHLLNGRRGVTEEWKPVALDVIEKEHINKILHHTKWNKSKASIILGVSLPRLERKIKKYNLQGAKTA